MLVKPDCEAINLFIQSDPRKRKREAIFRDAGLDSGGRLMRQWLKGGEANLDSLIALAEVLHGCTDVKQLIRHDQLPAISLTAWGSPVNEFRELTIDLLFSPKFQSHLLNSRGKEPEIREYVEHTAWDRISRMPIKASEIEQTLLGLCRMGLLRECKRNSRYQFYLRQFQPRQSKQALQNRIWSEIRCAKYALELEMDPGDDGAIREAEQINRTLVNILDELAEATETLRREPTIENALRVVELDTRYHQAFCGYDPSNIGMFGFALGTHMLPFSRLILAQCYLEEKELPMPEDHVSLQTMAMSFEKQLRANFELFNAAKSGEKRDRMALYRNIKGHPIDGQEFFEQSERIILFAQQF